MKVKGLLIDLDGVLYVGGQPVTGACEAIEYISREKVSVPVCLKHHAQMPEDHFPAIV